MYYTDRITQNIILLRYGYIAYTIYKYIMFEEEKTILVLQYKFT